MKAPGTSDPLQSHLASLLLTETPTLTASYLPCQTSRPAHEASHLETRSHLVCVTQSLSPSQLTLRALDLAGHMHMPAQDRDSLYPKSTPRSSDLRKSLSPLLPAKVHPAYFETQPF